MAVLKRAVIKQDGPQLNLVACGETFSRLGELYFRYCADEGFWNLCAIDAEQQPKVVVCSALPNSIDALRICSKCAIRNGLEW